MKKKIYLILVSVIQIILSIVMIVTAEELVETQLETITQVYAEFPVEFQTRMRIILEKGGKLQGYLAFLVVKRQLFTAKISLKKREKTCENRL